MNSHLYCLYFQVNNFKNIIKCLVNLNADIKNKLKFRVKFSHSLNSGERFAKIFGKNSVEDTSSVNFAESINESKLVLCFFPQTAYVESIYKNIPTILIGNKYCIFKSSNNQLILKKLKLCNMYFDDLKSAVNFLNSNHNNIFKWWNNRKVQETRKFFLNKYYDISDNKFTKFKNFLKREIKLLN